MSTQIQRFLIGLLTCTAALLLISLLRVDSTPPAVYGSGVTASSGDYVITVGSLSDRDEELVYVLDSSAQKMNTYRFDANRKQIELTQPIDLEALRKASQPTDSKKP